MRTTKLYVGSIPSIVTEAEIAKYFRKIDPSSNFVLIPSFRVSEKATTYGFLTVSNDAVSKILSMSHYYKDHKLVCEEHLSESQDSDLDQNGLRIRRLFMRNLKRPLAESDLETFFRKFGEVESVAIVRSHLSGKSRSFGYVTFNSQEVAQKVLQAGQYTIKGVTVYLHKYTKNGEESGEYSPERTPHDLLDSSDMGPIVNSEYLASLVYEAACQNPKQALGSKRENISWAHQVQRNNGGVKHRPEFQKIETSNLITRANSGSDNASGPKQVQTKLHKLSLHTPGCRPTPVPIFSRTILPLNHSESNVRFNVRLGFAPQHTVRRLSTLN